MHKTSIEHPPCHQGDGVYASLGTKRSMAMKANTRFDCHSMSSSGQCKLGRDGNWGMPLMPVGEYTDINPANNRVP